MRVVLALIFCAGLAACTSTGSASYQRLDGKIADDNQFKAVMAQCKGEAAQNAPGWVGGGLIGMGIAMNSSATKESDIMKACMARNGYVTG